MINGKGLYYKDGKPNECVWENDVKFVISSSEDDRISCSIVISLLFYGIVAANIYTEVMFPPFIVFAAMIYICM